MAKNPTNTHSSEGIQLDITSNYIDRCIRSHKDVLVNLIKSEHAPPADGAIVNIVRAIEYLESKIIPIDDKAGRGLTKEDPQ